MHPAGSGSFAPSLYASPSRMWSVRSCETTSGEDGLRNHSPCALLRLPHQVEVTQLCHPSSRRAPPNSNILHFTQPHMHIQPKTKTQGKYCEVGQG